MVLLSAQRREAELLGALQGAVDGGATDATARKVGWALAAVPEQFDEVRLLARADLLARGAAQRARRSFVDTPSQ